MVPNVPNAPCCRNPQSRFQYLPLVLVCEPWENLWPKKTKDLFGAEAGPTLWFWSLHNDRVA